MSVEQVRAKIKIVELAVKNAGETARTNAVIDVLKEIASTLEVIDKNSLSGTNVS